MCGLAVNTEDEATSLLPSARLLQRLNVAMGPVGVVCQKDTVVYETNIGPSSPSALLKDLLSGNWEPPRVPATRDQSCPNLVP